MIIVLKILNKRGLHARAAGKFVKTSGLFASEIVVLKNELEASGQSIMELLMLNARQEDQIMIKAEGVDAEQALLALKTLIENKFSED
jgi:phosphocarrier protein HPr